MLGCDRTCDCCLDGEACTVVELCGSDANDASTVETSSCRFEGEGSGSITETIDCSRDFETQQEELDSLPMEILVQILRAAAQAGGESMVRLGSASKNFCEAMKELQTQDPSIVQVVRQNQRIYHEIQSQVVWERYQRYRLHWMRGFSPNTERPSFVNALFSRPKSVPYLPVPATLLFGLPLMVYSCVCIPSTRMVYDQVLLALFGAYGGIISLAGIFYFLWEWYNLGFFFLGLVALYFLLLGTQIAVGLSCVTVAVLDSSRYIKLLSLVLVFLMSFWMIMSHARVAFEAGKQRAYAACWLALSTVYPWFFLKSIG